MRGDEVMVESEGVVGGCEDVRMIAPSGIHVLCRYVHC